jgi:hypothetical protein
MKRTSSPATYRLERGAAAARCARAACADSTARAACAALMVCAALVVAAPAPARARDVWTTPHPGVRHLRRVGAKLDVHVIVVDLRAAEVSLVVTRPEDRALTVDDFARRYDVQVAMNANFFDGAFRPCGMTRGDGVPARDAYEEACSATLGLGRLNEAQMFEALDPTADAPEPWMTDVVAGKPWLVRDGVALTGWPAPGHIRLRHPRSAVGLSRDRSTLFLVVADGRRSDALGLDGDELAALFVELGAHDAFNLDGGGSTSLYVAAEGGVVNRPSDGHARPLGNHIGVRVRPGARWYAARLEPSDAAPSASDRVARLEAQAAPGETTFVGARYRNVGRRPWPASALYLAAAGERPSALWDPGSWASPTRVVPRLGRVAPGEVAEVRLPAAAPVAPGRFEEMFVPALRGFGPLPEAAPLHVALTVAPDAVPRAHDARPAPPPGGGGSVARPGDSDLAVALVEVARPPESAPGFGALLGASREASIAVVALDPRAVLLACALGSLAAWLWPLRRALRVRAARNVRRA